MATPKEKEQAAQAFLEELSPVCANLAHLRHRYHWLTAVEAEVAKQLAGQSAEVFNFDLFRMRADSYRMLVIDVDSFANWFLKKGGFIGRLGNHVTPLRPGVEERVSKPSVNFVGPQYLSPEEREEFVQELWEKDKATIAKHTSERREKHFPDAEAGKVEHADLEKLKPKLKEALTVVKALRDEHAHVYQDGMYGPKHSKLALAPVDLALTELEEFLDDLRFMATAGVYCRTEPGKSIETLARDFVDLSFTGDINQVVQELGVIPDSAPEPHRYYWQHREKAPAKLTRGKRYKDSE